MSLIGSQTDHSSHKSQDESIHILVVDDDPDIRFATRRLLEQNGHIVTTAENADQCFKIVESAQPDIILLDAVMPGMGGIDVCRQLKSNTDTAHICIIMFSSLKTQSEHQSLGLEQGADDYIARPIKNREFLARVNAFIRMKKAEKQLQHNQEQLEVLVEKRTRELEKQIRKKEQAKAQLWVHTKKLEEKNIALNVLLENRDENVRKTADAIIQNFNRLVFPYHEKMKQVRTRDEILMLTKIVEKNTRESLSVLSGSICQTYQGFTPMEIQVADLVKAGKTSKEIAIVLSVSERSVFFHRHNIRRKLGIKGDKINLRTYLSSIE